MSAPVDVYVPDGSGQERALERTTHLAVGAHQDDVEGMALAAIQDCFDRDDRWFTGLVCADGAGSPRSGPYAGVADEEMAAIRRREQREAAEVGRYSAVVQLGHDSRVLRALDDEVVAGLADWIARCGARQVLTHNLADRHPTHVAVALAVVRALRSLPRSQQPERLLGGEAWRSLDWLSDEDRVELASPGSEKLAVHLLEVFDSQISGGKRYDLAFVGRRRANATLSSPHEVDTEDQVGLAMDMTPLLREPTLDPVAFVGDKIDRLRLDVERTIRSLGD